MTSRECNKQGMWAAQGDEFKLIPPEDLLFWLQEEILRLYKDQARCYFVVQTGKKLEAQVISRAETLGTWLVGVRKVYGIVASRQIAELYGYKYEILKETRGWGLNEVKIERYIKCT